MPLLTTRRGLGLAAVGTAALVACGSTALGTGHPAVGFGPVSTSPVVKKGETFYKVTAYDISFAAGQTMTWSGANDGTGTTRIDDVAIIQVTHQDGTRSRKLTIDYSNGCGTDTAQPPRDISSLFAPGRNTVTVTYKDGCGGNVSADPAFIS
jgi:hypothetical protein